MKLQRVPREPIIRARSSHFHQECGDWCFRYGCADGAGKCGQCRTKEFNAGRSTSSSDPDFQIYAWGLCFASVCTSLAAEDATDRLNVELPTGIESRWHMHDGPFATGEPNPHACERGGDRRHLLFSC